MNAVLNFHFQNEAFDMVDNLSQHSPDSLILRAMGDFKRDKIQEGIKKIKASFKYKFDDADIYSKRGMLLNFVVPKSASLPSGEIDFKMAIELNPNHILTKRGLLFQFLSQGQYNEALECLSDLENYYALLEQDVLFHSSNEGKLKNSIKILRSKWKLLSFEVFIPSYLSSLSDYFRKMPFSMKYNEWSLLSLSTLKMKLIERNSPPSLPSPSQEQNQAPRASKKERSKIVRKETQKETKKQLATNSIKFKLEVKKREKQGKKQNCKSTKKNPPQITNAQPPHLKGDPRSLYPKKKS